MDFKIEAGTMIYLYPFYYHKFAARITLSATFTKQSTTSQSQLREVFGFWLKFCISYFICVIYGNKNIIRYFRNFLQIFRISVSNLRLQLFSFMELVLKLIITFVIL